MHLQECAADAAAAFARLAGERRGVELAVDLCHAVEVRAGSECREQRRPVEGCPPLAKLARDEGLDAQWEAFLAATPAADHTVGGVFRFDTDKRPLMWIRFAARYARAHPNARFLLVGGGRLLDDAIALAESLGVRDRILFVGRSTEVGYWMKRMDVLVLMSSFEGLPNVLIEAQFLGVPVVSTPAGGAAECFIEGVTGHILGSAEKTDLDEACVKVQALLGRAHDPAIFEPATRDFLDAKFSVPRMLENFVSTSCGIVTESAAN
jgi:glycosyltransferase involved in cell wall biosynthesis